MVDIWRILEGGDERGRILSPDAQPEAGVVGGIGMGFMRFEANQANAESLGRGSTVKIRR